MMPGCKEINLLLSRSATAPKRLRIHSTRQAGPVLSDEFMVEFHDPVALASVLSSPLERRCFIGETA
jgi:hypothetical protein